MTPTAWSGWSASSGSWSKSLRLTRRGTYSFRAIYAGNTARAGCTSRANTVSAD